MKHYNITVTDENGALVSHETLEGDRILVVGVAETDKGAQKCELEWKLMGDDPSQIIGGLVKNYLMGKVKIPGFPFGRSQTP